MNARQYPALRKFAEGFLIGKAELAERTAGQWERWYYVETRAGGRLRAAGRATLLVVDQAGIEVSTYALSPRNPTEAEHEAFRNWAVGEACPPLPQVVDLKDRFRVPTRHVGPLLTALHRCGFWELSDCAASAQILDGEYYVAKGYFRGMDTATDGDVDACLFSPGESISPHLRRIERLFRQILGLDRGLSSLSFVSKVRVRFGI